VASRDRERRLSREHHERQQARRLAAREKARRRNATIGAAVATALVIGGVAFLATVVGGDEAATDPAAAASPAATPAASPGISPPVAGSASPEPTGEPTAEPVAGTCEYREEQAGGQVKDVGLPPVKNVETAAPYTATLQTNRGAVTINLRTDEAPCTVNSFRYLAGKDFYADTDCHRLTTEGIFVLQCGDPFGDGSGGPGYVFDEENLPAPGEVTYPKGTVAMARTAQPGTNGSQFFLVYDDTTLPPDYTIFGTVTEGLDIVEEVAAAGVEDGGSDGSPKRAVRISDVSVEKS
jgi:peptidyl-prolyl cis-trans isomerase B (cyclophilin B)